MLPAAPPPSTEAALDGQASRYFASLDASVGGLRQRAQRLIDRVNDSRKEDHSVMSGFRESLLLKVGPGAGSPPPAPAPRALLEEFNHVIPPELAAGRGAAGTEHGMSGVTQGAGAGCGAGCAACAGAQLGTNPSSFGGGCSCLGQRCGEWRGWGRLPHPSTASLTAHNAGPCSRRCSRSRGGHEGGAPAGPGTDGSPASAAAARGDSALGGQRGWRSSYHRRSWQWQQPSQAGSCASTGSHSCHPPSGDGSGAPAVPAAQPTPHEPFPPFSSPARQVSGLAEQLEERLFHLYGVHNELIQERLQELAEVMERVGQAEAELQQVCHTVEAAYRDLCLQPED